MLGAIIDRVVVALAECDMYPETMTVLDVANVAGLEV
jgi:hypothetical protein